LSERDGAHEAIEELSGVAALRALTPDEVRFVASHLAGCASCRRQYAELAAVADLLLRVPEPVEPPPGLRERILTLAAQTPQDAPAAGPHAAVAAPTQGVPASAAAPHPARKRVPGTQYPAPGTRLAPRLPRRPFDRRDLGLVASLAAALFFGYSTLRLQGELAAQSARLAQVEPIAHAAARGRTAPVAGTNTAPQIRGAVAEIDGRAQLYLEQLPDPPSDRLYQVWLIPPGGPPLGVGVSPPGEGGTQTIPLDRSLAGMQQIAVTLEPAPRGSDGPTSEIFASGQL
jgi:hypothetical protein